MQNVTDVDDPLLERAARDGRDWRELAAAEIALFREDMTALAVIPPDAYVGVVESMPEIPVRCAPCSPRARPTGSPCPTARPPASDVYLDLAQAPSFGSVSGLDPRADGGRLRRPRAATPTAPASATRFDPLLWRAARDGEPSWDGEVLGAGRPGWHIECTAIALDRLGHPFDVQGGGTDLVFPHHEMSAVQSAALTHDGTFARHYVHQAMVGFEGEKMSKSARQPRARLEAARRRRRPDGDPARAARPPLPHRLGLDRRPARGGRRRGSARWRAALSVNQGAEAAATLAAVRAALADDLDTPAALAAVDAWAERTLARRAATTRARRGVVARTVDALLGVRL